MPNSNGSTGLQTANFIHDNSQILIRAISSNLPPQNTLLPFVSQLTQPNETINPHLKTSIASQITLMNSK